MADWIPIKDAFTNGLADGRDLLVGVAPGGRQLVARWQAEVPGWMAVDQHKIEPTHYQELGEGPTEVPPAEPPVLVSLAPATAALGDPNFTLQVTGTGFRTDAVIFWNGAPEPTTVLSPTNLSTLVDMATAAAAAEIPVTVANGGGNGPPSNELTFSLTDPAGALTRRGSEPTARRKRGEE